jgi:hypothetical protein
MVRDISMQFRSIHSQHEAAAKCGRASPSWDRLVALHQVLSKWIRQLLGSFPVMPDTISTAADLVLQHPKSVTILDILTIIYNMYQLDHEGKLTSPAGYFYVAINRKAIQEGIEMPGFKESSPAALPGEDEFSYREFE